ncbi:conserved membrane hypothetical protein [Flavobacterium sp. 9AF]|uniref:hypothetical protein n=1 Tax=Flavobacterium sp. 9AF TaxID=2653142 RepID=UPI0012F12686|nr:hypothetical protein [Flavobacterium sp. 9AF]VXB64726.1 conserved membrane hypothetical protein [Flavobacterium sp. 9AF]
MNPLFVLVIQCTFSIVVFFLLGKWYLEPKMGIYSKYKILQILFLINVFRYLPLSLYMPGQVAENFPEKVKEIVAHGDFLAAIVALITLLLIKNKSRFTTLFINVFCIISCVDMVLALVFAMYAKVYLLPLGVNYFTIALYVPLLIIAQYYIFKILTLKNK